MSSRPPRTTRRTQLSFEDLGTPLAEVDLVVVDLETTGTDPAQDAITEIGAVKVRGGEVLGEFRTFVDPGRPIPAYIASLTGITDATVAGAPDIATVLPMFLDFARGAALVAHNARFDMAFLRAASARIDIPWPGATELDTLRLARLAFTRDEVRDHRLSTLAAHVGARTTPDHRALSDARATVDVLHAVIERLGAAATTLEDLAGAHRRASTAQIRQRRLADGVPAAPGVYQFVDEQGQVLYVGTSRNLRTRVRTYFTAAETRRKVLEMIPRACEIRIIVCETPTEAAIRELRIIAATQPPVNRHGLRPEKALWLRLGAGHEGLRGARIAREETDGSAQIGPLRSRHDVEHLRALLQQAVLGRGASLERGAGRITGTHHERMRRALLEDPSEVLDDVAGRLRSLAAAGRFEDAALLRGRTEAYLDAARRAQRLRSLAEVPLLVAARPAPAPAPQRPGWELIAIRAGRFAGTALVPAGGDPVAAARVLEATSHGEADLASPLCHGYHQEAEILLGWLAAEDVRIVLVRGRWAIPARARFEAESLRRAHARSGTGPDAPRAGAPDPENPGEHYHRDERGAAAARVPARDQEAP